MPKRLVAFTSRQTPASGMVVCVHSPSTRKRWSDLTPGQQTAILVAASVQISLAATAWVDLARRPAELVRGPKLAWAAAIAVNFVGPISYFAVGRRRLTAPQ
jgi:hypothetical protein